MAERKWGAITSGPTFEALATTVVFFKDQTAILFGRRGKDGGQDARSGDGSRVFQAKHHEDGSAKSAIRDAKKEAAKIHEYREPGHSRHSQWLGVTKWRLITNAVFNPTDKQTWDTEVVPLFVAEGLEADYWERENLNGLLDRYPEIHRSFFENETRVFLSVPEARERLLAEEPFLRRDELGRFCGRTTELEEVRSFLASSDLFLVVHGAGGIGKTRLLVKAGEDIAAEGHWQVLWANVASMAATSAWFEGMVPERPTLLLVDEPPDEKVLQQLAEQHGGRTASWKVVVAVRSPKDPVLRFLRSPRMKPRLRELAVSALPETDAAAMCEDLLATGKLASLPVARRNELAKELSRRFDGRPVWLTLAIHLLDEHGDLATVPNTAKGLAAEYLAEIESSQSEFPVEQIRALLRWIALVGVVNRDDDTTIKLLSERSGVAGLVDVRQKLAVLVGRGALIQRGAHNRFVELKPDVLRDHVLLGWLTADVGYGATHIIASDDARTLIEPLQEAAIAGTFGPLQRSILLSLSRTEMLLQLSGNAVSLLGSFLEALREAAPSMSVSQRLALINVLETIAVYHPVAAAAVVETLWKVPAAEERVEGIFGDRFVRQDDVVLALALPLFYAAMGAQDEHTCEVVLRQLCALVEAEAEVASRLKGGLPNDGRRASALVQRVLEGGPQFWSDFDATALKLGQLLLTTLASQPLTAGTRALVKALVQPAIAVERSQTWGNEHALHMRTFTIGDEHPGWTTRTALLAQVKGLLSNDSTPIASRIALWSVLAEAHRGVNRICRRDEPKDLQFYQILLNDLVWAGEVLQPRIANIAELSAARELWDWHRQFESDARLKVAGDALEALYTANELAGEFEPLVNYGDMKRQKSNFIAKAAELARARTPEDIAGFVERATIFFGSEDQLDRLMEVAWELGPHAQERESVAGFVLQCLQGPNVHPRGDFGAVIAASWLTSRRKVDEAATLISLMRNLMEVCGSDNQRANLLLRVYGGTPRPLRIGELLREEIELFRRESERFVDTVQAPAFAGAIAIDLAYDWDNVRVRLEFILNESATPGRQLAVFRTFIEGVYWAVRATDPALLPAELGAWLLDQLLRLSDFDELGGGVEWHLGEIFKRVGRVHLSWLPKALAARRDLEASTRDTNGVRALSYHSEFSRYVYQISATDASVPTAINAVQALLEFVDDHGSVGYRLAQVLSDIDPDGLLVAEAVATRLGRSLDLEGTRRLARIGGAYVVGTPAWRTIAKAAMLAVVPLGSEATRSIFNALSGSGSRSWTSKVGEVPAVFISAVERAQAARDAESDEDFRPFWEWWLAIAEAELREEEEDAKEERGE